MPSFNLVNEQWIPCRMTAGPAEMLSLRQALTRAHEVGAIQADSPLATAAIHRLLLAVLYRSGIASDDDGWSERWAARDIGPAAVAGYLDRWASRFDLFDAVHPFYQTPGLRPEDGGTVAKLMHELNAGNNAALFDHSLDQAPPSLAPSLAAQALVAIQAFAPGGLLSFEKGKLADKSADAAPLVKAGLVLMTGGNLVETLLLNLFRIDEDAAVPFAHRRERDLPAWERDEPTRAMDRRPDGPVDLLTWQSRRVLLVPEQDEEALVVRKAVIMKGNQFPSGFVLGLHEPMVAFREVPKPAAGQDPMPPVGFRPERSLWRDSLALLMDLAPDTATKRTGFRRPRNLADLSRRDFSGTDPRPRVTVLGLGVDRAKLLLWRQEEFPLPLAYLDPDNGELVARLEKSVALAVEAGHLLRSSVWKLSATVLSPDNSPDRKRVDALVGALAPERKYWSRLDVPFRRLIVDLAEDYARDGGSRSLGAWRHEVAQAAHSAFDVAAGAVEMHARGLKAAAEARGLFGALLSRQLREFESVEAII